MNKSPQKTRMLIVDDEPAFRRVMEMYFVRKGFEVFSASNGREAFDFLKKQAIDVVVSDVRMPDGDGVEFLHRARSENINTPVILLMTGYADLTTEQAYNKGAEALFIKPFDHKELERTVHRLLTPREQRWSQVGDNITVDMQVNLQFQSVPEAIAARVISLGRGGMFVALSNDQMPNPSDTLSFSLNVGKKQETVSGTGIVRWMRMKTTPEFASGCGIEFVYLGETEKRQVLSFLESERVKAYIPNL